MTKHSVYWNKARQKWMAQLYYKGKLKNLGYFDNEEDAARAVDAKAKEIFGDKSKLNFS